MHMILETDQNMNKQFGSYCSFWMKTVSWEMIQSILWNVGMELTGRVL